VALSDPLGILASPHTVVEHVNDKEAIEAIIDIIEQNGVGNIVIGLPRSMDGSIGKQAKKVEAFIEELSRQTKIPMEFRDERLTTVAAKRLKQAAGKRKTGQRSGDDAEAAAVILQGYLDER